MSREITFRNLNCCDITYGAVLDAIELTEQDPFILPINSEEEWDAIDVAITKESDLWKETLVDAELEFNRDVCIITPHNLCILLRRLTEGPYKSSLHWDLAYRIQHGILTKLGFNPCGEYVGLNPDLQYA